MDCVCLEGKVSAQYEWKLAQTGLLGVPLVCNSMTTTCRPAFLPEEQLHMGAEEVERTVELQESLAVKIAQSRNF